MIILLKGNTATHHPAQVVCLTLCKHFSLYKPSRTFSLNINDNKMYRINYFILSEYKMEKLS